MVMHWKRERGRAWRLKAMLNGLGALATGVTFVIVGSFKFFDGAWIAVLLIPVLVAIFLHIHGRREESSIQTSTSV
jgi:peptidoglycan/LPS O-acetylase OafA/YrhL